MDRDFQQMLAKEFKWAIEVDHPAEIFTSMRALQFSAGWKDVPDWTVGPFQREPEMVFRKEKQWADPTGIGWTSSYIFNPTLFEDNGRLHLIYRTSPKKESLGSRIGQAWSDDGGRTWEDSPENPIIYPTEWNELLSCEDPKIYRHEGVYYLFYNGAWRQEPAELEKINAVTPWYPFAVCRDLCCDILLATSTDLIHWEKRGLVVPYEISRYWVKGAVIPRNPAGEPVRVNGQFLMFLSDGCCGQQHIGYSSDLLHWTFKPQTYLPLPAAMGTLYEVACAITAHEPTGEQLVLDFYYAHPDGSNGSAQALYNIHDVTTPLAIHEGGTLCWGGLIQFQGKWLYPQGWDAPLNKEEMYFYSAPVKK